jgi:predicted ATPase
MEHPGPPRTLDAARTNLPALRTPLLGRERQLGAVRSLLADDDVRLVTLIGPGGCGKTRLALGAGGEASDLFTGGTYVTFLAGARTPDAIVPAIATALDVREEPGRPLLATVVDRLREPATLLIVDNFEHLLDGAPVVGDLLAGAPALKVLTTSRASLRLTGEHELDVPPLAESDGVRLFLQRAAAIRPAISSEVGVTATARQICQRVDGLPLAIELAAGRVRSVPPETVLRRLDDSLDILAGGARDLPERQRTLRATIAWSHDLLLPAEQRLLHRLAVFVGGFPLDLAEQVVGPGVDLTEGVGSLVEQSLLRPIDPVADEPRFLMLETIRAFALERLHELAKEDTTRDRHAEAIVRFAEDAAQAIAQGRQTEALDRIHAEMDNVRLGLARMRQTGRIDLELRLVAALRHYAMLRGHWGEVRDWVEHALAHRPDDAPIAYARALESALPLTQFLGDFDRAAHFARELHALALKLGDRRARAHALKWLGSGEIVRRGDPAQARAWSEESVELWRAIGDTHELALALISLGDAELFACDIVAARVRFGQAAELGDRLGFEDCAVLGALNLANTLVELGEPAEATRVLVGILPRARSLGSPHSLYYGITAFAPLALAAGDPERAARLVGTLDGAFDRAGLAFFGFERHRHDALIATLDQLLGTQRLKELREEGRARQLDELLDEAVLALPQ